MGKVDIAVVGVSAFFPGSNRDRDFWRDILGGVDLLSPVPESRWLVDDYGGDCSFSWDGIYARRGGFIEDVEFDPLEFGIPPADLSATDASQLLALVVAKRLFDDAGTADLSGIDRQRVGVILGMAAATELAFHTAGRLQRPLWEEAMRRAGLKTSQIDAVTSRIDEMYVPFREATFPGLLANVAAGRVANRFDLGGTNRVVDAACASALAALEASCRQLADRRADMMIAGGIDLLTDAVLHACFSKIGALSKKGECRPFDADADGTLLGEGLGLFALKRLEDAEARDDRIYAVIAGVGSSSDGRSKSIYAPHPNGQARALEAAYEDAGFSPRTVELIEAHGTATTAGDAAEIEALRSQFEPHGDGANPWCALGSVKSQIGHSRAAAGAAGLFKAIMALHHRILPPTAKVEKPNPALAGDNSPFYVNTTARPWINDGSAPRRSGVSAFGFGGTNFHVALEEYDGPNRAPRRRSLDSELFVLSADDPGDLIDQCQHWKRRLARKDGAPSTATSRDNSGADEKYSLPWAAQTSQQNFEVRQRARLAIVTSRISDLVEKLSIAEDAIATNGTEGFSNPRGIHYGFDLESGPIAFLFPGQGSQYLAMGAHLAMHFESARRVWDHTGDLHRVVFPPSAFSEKARAEQRERLRSTDWAQPAIGAMSLSILRLLREIGLEPDFAAGHSFGELTALCAARVFDEKTFLDLARRRGRLMADASEIDGAMTAVAMSIEELSPLIDECSADVTIANHNAPAQVVVAGGTPAINELESHLRRRDKTFRRLDVATAFHSPLIADAAAPFRRALDELSPAPPRIPVLANSTARDYGSGADEIRDELSRQLTKKVRFFDIIESLYERGARTFVEVGPGSTLKGLVGKCLHDRPHRAVAVDRRSSSGTRSLWSALGYLSTRGVELDFDPLWRDYETPEEPTDGDDAHTVRISATIYDKPYPPPQGSSRPLRTSSKDHDFMSDDKKVNHDEILQILREQQRQTAEAHRIFQETTAEAHRAFLKTMEESFQSFKELAAGVDGDLGEQLGVGSDLHGSSPSSTPPTGEPPTPAGVADASGTEARRPVAISGGSEEIAQVVAQVVADKTGYPAEMLQSDMELEADLGVDSIKQVEIASALEDRLPGLAELDPTKMAELRSLGQIATHLEAAVGGRRRRTSKSADRDDDDGDDSESDQPSLRARRFVVGDVAAPPCGWAAANLDKLDHLIVVAPGDGDRAFATAIVDNLDERGVRASICTGDLPPDADGVIVGPDVDPRRALLGAAKLARRHIPPRIFVTVDDSQMPWSGLPGLAKTAAAEWPDTAVKAITVDIGELGVHGAANLAAAEVLAGGPQLEVRYDGDGVRSVPIAVDKPTGAASSPPIEEGAVVICSGGARGITSHCIAALHERIPLRLALIGRTELSEEPPFLAGVGDEDLKRALFERARRSGGEPTPLQLERRARHIAACRQIRRTLSRLESQGGQARYLSADIRDRRAVCDLVDEVRRQWGPVRGIIHGAGVIDDALIADKTGRQFDAVFGTKVDGLRALLEATKDDPLGLVCLFSSVAARSGNPGQSDYAMANTVLNGVARLEASSRDDCVVKSLGWGPWDGGMVDDGLSAHFERHGVPLISIEQGTEMMVDEILCGGNDVELLLAPSIFAEGLQTLQISRTRSAKIVIDASTHPYLDGHRIRGTPVVPAMLVLEWFARFAGDLRPEKVVQQISDFRVLKGIGIDDFDGPGIEVEIRGAFRRDDSTVEIELASPDHLHYSGVVKLGAAPLGPPSIPGQSQMADSTIDVEESYHDGRLFHDGPFRALRSLEYCDDNRASATVAGLFDLDWPTENWCIDPALLDGALQACLLWGLELIDRPTIIMKVDRFRPFTDGPLDEEANCHIALESRDHRRLVVDILVSDSGGAPLYELRNVEMYAVTGGL